MVGPWGMRKTVQAFLVTAVVLDIVYWTLWYADNSVVASENTRAYQAFENAFPLADTWLGVCCLLSLITMRLHRSSALFWLLCAGSAGLYLFSMDLLYDLRNDIFAQGGAGVVEAIIVVLTLVFSVTVLAWSWSHRGELLSGASDPTQGPTQGPTRDEAR